MFCKAWIQTNIVPKLPNFKYKSESVDALGEFEVSEKE